MITNRELPGGTTLAAKFKKTAYTCEVVVDDGGKRSYRLPDGRTFGSPSAAGTAITETACNGWRFWSVEGEEPAPALAPKEDKPARTKRGPSAAAAPKTRTQTGKRVTMQIKRARSQEGCTEGEVRWFCSACMDGWCSPAKPAPTVCPQGHPRFVHDELAPLAGEEDKEPIGAGAE